MTQLSIYRFFLFSRNKLCWIFRKISLNIGEEVFAYLSFDQNIINIRICLPTLKNQDRRPADRDQLQVKEEDSPAEKMMRLVLCGFLLMLAGSAVHASKVTEGSLYQG